MLYSYDLEWEGTFGYGDIVRSLANAQWHHRIKQRPVEMRIFWNSDRYYYPPETKYRPTDPETILERFNIIQSLFDLQGNVRVTHEHDYKEKVYNEPSRTRWVNRLGADQMWVSQVGECTIQPTVEKKIVVWSGSFNKHSPVTFKNPLSMTEWDLLLVHLDDYAPDYEIVHLSYKDKVLDVINHIASSSLCIGYHGFGNGFASNFYKPSLIFSTTESYTRKCSGPWIKHIKDVQVGIRSIQNIDELINTQLEEIKKYKLEYQRVSRLDPRDLQSYLATYPDQG